MSLPKVLSSSSDTRSRTKPSLTLPTARSRKLREQSSNNASDVSLNLGDGYALDGPGLNEAKEDGPLDWYLEGPGRRVGYDDLTAIDWIFEYTKERQRVRLLYSQAASVFTYASQLFDASHIWLVLIGTGLTCGAIAAGIDIASDWLGDLKLGFCRNGLDGGRFYLSKGFCCWGYEGKRLIIQIPERIDQIHSIFSMSGLDCLEQCTWHTIKRRKICS